MPPPCKQISATVYTVVKYWVLIWLCRITCSLMTGNSSSHEGFYFRNSIRTTFDYTETKMVVIWTLFSISGLFILHCAYINGSRWHLIRYISDGVLFETMLACIMLDLAGRYSSDVVLYVWLRDIFVYGIFGCTLQVIDNYLVYSLYYATHRNTSRIKKYAIHLYIWLTCFSILPIFTTSPLYYSADSKQFDLYVLIASGYIWSAMYLLFNIYFGWKIWNHLQIQYAIRNRLGKRLTRRISPETIMHLSYRNILHLFLV